MNARINALNIVLIGALAGAASAQDKEVNLSEVPAPVKATIDQKVAGAAIEEIEVEEEDGRQIYSVEFMRDGKEVEIEIAADGQFLGEDTDGDDDQAEPDARAEKDDGDDEQEIDQASAPDAVTAALKPLLSGATVKKMTKETEDGQVLYEAEYSVNGKERFAELNAAGAVLELEEVIAVEEIPAAVRDAVKKLHPSGVVKKVESVVKKPGAAEVHSYEIDVLSNGKIHEVDVDRTGKVLESDEDDDD